LPSVTTRKLEGEGQCRCEQMRNRRGWERHKKDQQCLVSRESETIGGRSFRKKGGKNARGEKRRRGWTEVPQSAWTSQKNPKSVQEHPGAGKGSKKKNFTKRKTRRRKCCPAIKIAGTPCERSVRIQTPKETCGVGSHVNYRRNNRRDTGKYHGSEQCCKSFYTPRD